MYDFFIPWLTQINWLCLVIKNETLRPKEWFQFSHFDLHVVIFQQHLHMESMYLIWCNTSELCIAIMISLIEGYSQRGNYLPYVCMSPSHWSHHLECFVVNIMISFTVADNVCYRWLPIRSICYSHNPVLRSSCMGYQRINNTSDKTAVTSGAGTAYRSRIYELIPSFGWVCFPQSSVFYVRIDVKVSRHMKIHWKSIAFSFSSYTHKNLIIFNFIEQWII